MNYLLKRWKDISITKKLYTAFGIMAVLIAGELLVLHFALTTLSAVRAFVSGEGLWSKAQKNAVISLERFSVTRDEADYRAFLDHFRIPAGDRKARLELSKPAPDLAVVREGFLEGDIHPDDIEPMIDLLQRFHWVSFIRRAMAAWAEGDEVITRLQEAGREYYELARSRDGDEARMLRVFEDIHALNGRLTEVENEFSRVLGEGSRWLEHLVVFVLFLAVITVESIGLTLTFLTSRGISLGLAEIATTADAIGRGDFQQRVRIQSKDEIGRLAESVNRMGRVLQRSYAELERRVQERTTDLAQAVRVRDDFLSVASHELKTPLTSLKLNVQLRARKLEKGDLTGFTPEKLKQMVAGDERQVNRLVRLVDDMLDVSRLNRGKLELQPEPFDLVDLVNDVLERFAPHIEGVNSKTETELAGPLPVRWDYYRIEQALTNILTNAMKYGAGKAVRVSAWKEGDTVLLRVRDQGIGIARADHERIFQPFERAVSSSHISGLGLGLHIANEIVRLHGGRILVESEEGKGAAFTFELPREAPRTRA